MRDGLTAQDDWILQAPPEPRLFCDGCGREEELVHIPGRFGVPEGWFCDECREEVGG